MKFLKDEAIVLRKKRFQDHHEIIDLFTRNFGKISAVAKGVKRPVRPLCYDGYPDSLSLISIHYFERDSRSLVSLIGTELLDSFLDMRRNYESILQAWVIVEALDKGFPTRLASPESFDLIKTFFQLLDKSALREILVYYFVRQLSLWGQYPEKILKSESRYSASVRENIKNWFSGAEYSRLEFKTMARDELLKLLDDLSMEVQIYLGSNLKSYKIYRRYMDSAKFPLVPAERVMASA